MHKRFITKRVVVIGYSIVSVLCVLIGIDIYLSGMVCVGGGQLSRSDVNFKGPLRLRK